jgi:hypothetical protein
MAQVTRRSHPVQPAVPKALRAPRPCGKCTTPASPSGEAGDVTAASLQRDPHPEEVKAPLIEPGIPERCFLVAPVVDWATSPATTGRGERSAPRWPWRRAPSPGCRTVAPRGPVEVATLSVPTPWPAGSAGTTGSARAVVVGRTARSARAMEVSGRRCAVVAAGCACGCAVVTTRGRRCAVAARARPARSWGGVGRTGAHTQCRCAQSTDDGHAPD